jgi:hypothetical protein
MNVYEIFVQIIDKPNAINFYNQFYEYLKSKGQLNEASAIQYLIEKKFDKK